MKKILILLVLFIINLSIIANAEIKEKNIFGFNPIKDRYNSKVFILHVVNDSPAYNAGLNSGYEIVYIDKYKLKNLSKNEIINILSTKEEVNIVAKDFQGNKNTYKLKKALVKAPKNKYDETFITYWHQIIMGAPVYQDEMIDDINNILCNKNISPRMRQELNNQLSKTYRQQQLRDSFYESYSHIKKTTKAKDLNKELSKLVNDYRTIISNNITQEMQLRQQQYLYIQQQRQLEQQRRQNLCNSIRQGMEQLKQDNYRNQQLNLQREQIGVQRMQVMMNSLPKTYNVNLNHSIRYGY